ncbi:MAG: polysaccharide deacetylase family protein [Puniceicoccaceae bacterium]
MQALLSVHDLMPETIPAVTDILRRLEALGIHHPTLLVVPGLPWDSSGIDQLRKWSDSGKVLAAHGWLHRTQPRRWFHRLHSAFISRQVAEHLALDSHAILNLIHQSGDWFVAHNLPRPSLYVPPAWALGPLTKRDHLQLSFQAVETLRGVHCHQPGSSSIITHTLPLLGFEADTRLRAFFLRHFNRYNFRLARKTGKPLRISIHPRDFELLLADRLDQLLRQPFEWLPYRALYQPEKDALRSPSPSAAGLRE